MVCHWSSRRLRQLRLKLSWTGKWHKKIWENIENLRVFHIFPIISIQSIFSTLLLEDITHIWLPPEANDFRGAIQRAIQGLQAASVGLWVSQARMENPFLYRYRSFATRLAHGCRTYSYCNIFKWFLKWFQCYQVDWLLFILNCGRASFSRRSLSKGVRTMEKNPRFLQLSQFIASLW